MLKRKPKVQPFGASIQSGAVGSILSRLYRTIMHDVGIDHQRYSALMERYIKQAANDPNRQEKAMARAGLSKELLKDVMTWRSFIKGLQFLHVETFSITLTLTHSTGKKSKHILLVKMSDLEEEKVGSVLSQLYRTIIDDLGIDQEKYNILMESYIRLAHNDPSRQEKATARAGLSKELLKDAMTWKSFVKGLTFLHVSEFEILLGLKYEIGKTSTHILVVQMGELNEDEEGDKDD